MPVTDQTAALLAHLARQPGHDEVKAGFRDLLVREFGVEQDQLEFEKRVPEVRGRLDAIIGRTVFEAKRDLKREWADVERRMPDYLADREREEGERFVGIASDGKLWVAFERQDGALVRLTDTTLNPDKPDVFLAWLDGVIALKGSLPPDALTVRAELGKDSVAYRRVDRDLRALWDTVKSHPAETLKRQLWGDLLKLVYGREVEGDALWFQHSYLVVVAKCIALAVMELPEDDPRRLLSGDAFTQAGIAGAVESDFFDWMVAVPQGEELVRRIMAHVRRFRLREVESDVLKILYESLIDRDERHGLGEYYTPDWLAAKIVRHAVDRPLEQKVLDPACGSGTFLFHAVRRVLAEAEEAGMDGTVRAAEACALVAGTDIHPVAVIIARVTYLLALAPALGQRSGGLSVPVYLGDAMQLSISQVIGGKELVIQVPPPPAGAGTKEKLGFPETFCRDPALFDKAIEAMRTGSLAARDRDQVEADITRRTEQHYKRDTTDEERLAIGDLGVTYETFHRLRLEGRDTIWSYVARNLSRPLALATGGGWANVLVGNPPWVAYRHMSADLQKRFKELAKGEGLYERRAPSQNDLCSLFVVRASHLYLRPSGRLAFVLPLSALTRIQFERFRTGQYGSYNVAWDEAWTTDVKVGANDAIFPVPSCVILGRKRAIAKGMPKRVTAYTGSLPFRDASETIADPILRIDVNAPAPAVAQSSGGSEYRQVFRCGANLFPRMLLLIERKKLGRLGADAGAPAVMSKRSVLEKQPWRSLPAIEGNVEKQFLRQIYLGESILPHRVFQPFEGVIPVTELGLLVESHAASQRGYNNLSQWLTSIEVAWAENGKQSRDFLGQINYIGQLSSQFPIPAIRVVYSKSGSQPAACIIRDERAVIDHKLYWAKPDSEEEANYLTAILNSEHARERASGYQSRGQFGARDFDKVIWNLPIPRFDGKLKLHRELAVAGTQAGNVADLVELIEGERFVAARQRVRRALADDGIGGHIEKLVEKLLGPA